MVATYNIVILGLSITSSWGNGHATTYRALTRELARRGHRVTFLECDKPWYRSQRDLPRPAYCRLHLYDDLASLARHEETVRQADLVIVGSYVPEGVAVGEWVIEQATGLTAFYDIDTPVTLAKLDRGDYEYLCPELIGRYGLYLSFTGGPTLERIRREFGSGWVEPFYCSADDEQYYPEPVPIAYTMGYLGTYSPDRQPGVEALLIEPARRLPDERFIIAGSGYPDVGAWPGNVTYVDHLPPSEHRGFYNGLRFTLNVTREEMIAAGHSPSVRLFEAGACGTAIISDSWPGLEQFFIPDREILIARTTEDVVGYLGQYPQESRRQLAQRCRRKVLAHHTARSRAAQLEEIVGRALAARRPGASRTAVDSGVPAHR